MNGETSIKYKKMEVCIYRTSQWKSRLHTVNWDREQALAAGWDLTVLNNDGGDDVKENVDKKEMVCVDIEDNAMQKEIVPPSACFAFHFLIELMDETQYQA